MTATATRKLRPGQIIRYDGSLEDYAGRLFRVNRRYECDGTCVRDGRVCDLCSSGSPVQYDLSAYAPGRSFSESDAVILQFACAKSVTPAPAGR